MLEYTLLAIIYAMVFILATRERFMPVLVHCWLIPLLIVILLANVRGWAENAATEDGHPLTSARTITSNRLVFFLMCGLNYHVEHHLFPRIPWYNVPRVHDLLQNHFRAARTPIYRSYLRFLLDAMRVGVYGRAPRLQAAPVSE